MHSSHPWSWGEKILIDMDRIRKSSADFTGGKKKGRGMRKRKGKDAEMDNKAVEETD